MLDPSSKFQRFQNLVGDLKRCNKCSGLNIEGLTENSPGYGNLNSKVMIIGQSLCRPCMETQIPFTGGSGRILDQAFKIAGLQKSDVFITNVVHCHTPDNRKSLPHEVTNCSPFLAEEIELVDPAIIIPLGQDAIISVLGTDSWPRLVGKKLSIGKRTVHPLYHPSYVMKRGKDAIAEYVNNLARILNGNGKDTRRE